MKLAKKRSAYRIRHTWRELETVAVFHGRQCGPIPLALLESRIAAAKAQFEAIYGASS